MDGRTDLRLSFRPRGIVHNLGPSLLPTAAPFSQKRDASEVQIGARSNRLQAGCRTQPEARQRIVSENAVPGPIEVYATASGCLSRSTQGPGRSAQRSGGSGPRRRGNREGAPEQTNRAGEEVNSEIRYILIAVGTSDHANDQNNASSGRSSSLRSEPRSAGHGLPLASRTNAERRLSNPSGLGRFHRRSARLIVS